MRFVRTAENLFGLPQGFTRVEYLQSSGTQYIDTGVVGNGEFNIKYGLYVNLLSSSSDIFAGARSSTQHLNFGQSASNGQFTIGYLNQYWQELQNFAINTRYDIEISYKSGEQYAIINGTKGSSKTYTGTEQTDLTIYLFKRHHYGTDNVGGLQGRIYYFTIKQNDTLVRDFIPCIDPLGVPCMYDLVGKKPYYNQGTGTFTAGRQVIPVDYLESTGTQYINTGHAFTDGFSWEIDFEGISDGTTLFGGRTSSTRTALLYQRNYGGIDLTTCPIAGYNGQETPFQFTDLRLGRHTIKMSVASNKGSVWVDGAQVYNEQSFTGTYISGTTQALFADNFGSSVSEYTSSKVYSLKMWQGSTLVRDFIPCKDENNVGYMFDTLSGTVYLNAGTGAFSVGENKHTSKLRLIKDAIRLPDGYTRVEYLESTGTQYIDTGYIPTNTTGVQVRHTICADNSKDNIVFGCREGSGDTRFWEDIDWTNSDTIGWGFNSYSSTTAGTRFPISGMAGQTIVSSMNFMNDRAGRVNGVPYDTSLETKTLVTITRSICLFAANYAGTMSLFTACKIFSCQISEGSTLARSFIPVRDENNVGYMFDEVTGQMFGNAGSGSFGIGNDLPTAKVRFIQDVIPSDYLPLKYLESTGTQYIDLGIQPTDTYGYRIKNTYTVGKGEQCAIGCMDSGNRFVGVYTSGSANQLSGAWGSFVGFLPTYSWTTDDILDVEVNYKNSRKMIVGGTELKDVSDVHISGTINNTLYLFARNYGSNVTKMYGKIYSVQVSNGQDFVLDLYPALRKSDNKLGMYDRITKQFFVNQGTGEFNYEV